MRSADTILLLATASVGNFFCNAALPDVALVSAVSSAVGMTRPIIICDWVRPKCGVLPVLIFKFFQSNSSLASRRSLFRDLSLGASSLRQTYPSENPLSVGGGLICADDVGQIAGFLEQSPEVGASEPWVVLAPSAWPLKLDIFGRLIAINRRVYVLALDAGPLYEVYSINEQAVTRRVGSFSSENEVKVDKDPVIYVNK